MQHAYLRTTAPDFGGNTQTWSFSVLELAADPIYISQLPLSSAKKLIVLCYKQVLSPNGA